MPNHKVVATSKVCTFDSLLIKMPPSQLLFSGSRVLGRLVAPNWYPDQL